ncbi:50S ribosomal protein P1 [archaeon]|nr:50S ribosomal protein P1 [archaeon]
MEFVYAALMLHSAKKEVNEASLKKIAEAAGLQADEVKIKALVASLEGVNIDDAIKQSVAFAAAPATTVAPGGAAPAKEEKKEEKKSEEEAAGGLAALFG